MARGPREPALYCPRSNDGLSPISASVASLQAMTAVGNENQLCPERPGPGPEPLQENMGGGVKANLPWV